VPARADRLAIRAVLHLWIPTSRFVLRAYMVKLYGLIVIPQKEIASKGGKASGAKFEPGSEKAREAGRKGGQSRKKSSDSSKKG